MKLSRRDAIRLSGTTVAGLSLGVVSARGMLGQARAQQECPDRLVEGALRQRAAFPQPVALRQQAAAPEREGPLVPVAGVAPARWSAPSTVRP